MINELKEYRILLIPLVILIIISSRAEDIGKLIWGKYTQTQIIPELKHDDSNEKQSNKVYINSDFDDETFEYESNSNQIGKIYSIFIYNETAKSIKANEKITIKPNKSFVFNIPDTMGIAMSNGIQFFFGETEGLEVIDNDIQVAGIGGEWLDKLNVPETADWAFSILNAGEGDPIPEE